MKRIMFKSKIHRARVTQAELYYEGSITIDRDLMAQADILEYEKVQVVNVNNGQRFETYALKGDAGSGTICLNGAAARLGHVGDEVIIITYAEYSDDELADHSPAIILVDEHNNVKQIL
jgi:aspartate 1-decarboxylase